MDKGYTVYTGTIHRVYDTTGEVIIDADTLPKGAYLAILLTDLRTLGITTDPSMEGKTAVVKYSPGNQLIDFHVLET